MKKFGLIGGIGPESSIAYYRLIVKEFQDKLNTKDYPELVMHSINMTEMLSYVYADKLDELCDFLVTRVDLLESSGVDFAAMASNTPHIVFDQLSERSGIPLISIVEETCKSVKEKGLNRVGLFGTKSTMTAGFYQETAKRHGIEMISPGRAEQDYIHEKYMGELVLNQIIPDTKKKLVDIAKSLVGEASIEGLVLGGTELPLILNQSDLPGLQIFDTTEIHVAAIISEMLS